MGNLSHIPASGFVVDAGRAECAAGGVGSCSHLLLPHRCTSIRDLGVLGHELDGCRGPPSPHQEPSLKEREDRICSSTQSDSVYFARGKYSCWCMGTALVWQVIPGSELHRL